MLALNKMHRSEVFQQATMPGYSVNAMVGYDMSHLC